MKSRPTKTHTKKQREPVDSVIGRNLRLLRRAAGVGSPKLAAHLNLSYQQLQKYETGANRLSCSTLYAIATYLKRSPLVFFSGLDLPASTLQLGGEQVTRLTWRDTEILQLLQSLDRDTKATVISILRALQ